MATKNQDDTNESNESLNENPVIDLVEHIVAYANAHDAYRIMPLPSFEMNRYLGAELEQKETGDELILQFPTEFRDAVAFVRVGEHETGTPIVIATNKDALGTLMAEGLAYEQEEVICLPFADGDIHLGAHIGGDS